MKKRSTAPSCSARSRCSRYAATMLALCALYQLAPVGRAAKSIHSAISGDDGSPPNPLLRATISQPSRSRRSLTARHQRLPGTSPLSGASTPRSTCQRMNDSAARRNRRCGADASGGSSYVRAHSEKRSSGLSRTCSTCAVARSAAVSAGGIAGVSPNFALLDDVSRRLPARCHAAAGRSLRSRREYPCGWRAKRGACSVGASPIGLACLRWREHGARVTDDPYDLQRFVTAQDAAGTYERALSELRAGRKRSHWIWFVFPQIAGLGHSDNARAYALSSLTEAKAYVADPVLGRRLLDWARTPLAIAGKRAKGILRET